MNHLQDAHMQPELQLSGNAATIPTSVPIASSMPSEAPSYSSIQAANSSLMEEDEIKELESGDDFIHVSVRKNWSSRKIREIPHSANFLPLISGDWPFQGWRGHVLLHGIQSGYQNKQQLFQEKGVGRYQTI